MGAFKIYPNPTAGIFNIDIESVNKIQVINMLGELVKEEQLILKKQNINIQNLQNGIYFLQVFNKNKLIGSAKIIKQ